MRLLKVSQHIVFRENAYWDHFEIGQEATFTGYLRYHNNNIVIGYLKQEPITCNSLILYVKGYWKNSSELVLVGTTKGNFSNVPYSIALCSYFPSIYNYHGDGYVDETFGGITSKEGSFFFIGGDYLAKSSIQIEPLIEFTEDGARAKKKLNKMINNLYVAKKHNNLAFSFLFDYIQPYWDGAHWNLIDIYPNN